jgi:type VI secretion system protein ImpF
MGRFEAEPIIAQSLLDRLTDEDPATSTDPPSTRAQSFRQFKAALRRDLEALLNTRQTPRPAPDGFPELARSLYNYGLPDIASISPGSSDQVSRLLALVEEAVMKFEPRLTQVRVIPESARGNVRLLRFRIEGLARTDPAPERVSFDTVLELTRGEYEVK